MATPPKYPPERAPIANKDDVLRVDRTWLAFFNGLANQAAAAGGGTVTHTGTLTANEIVLGNGGGDLKVLGSFGTAGQVLTSQGVGLPPIFQAAESAWIPLVTGSEPPTFVTDGAGHLILVAF